MTEVLPRNPRSSSSISSVSSPNTPASLHEKTLGRGFFHDFPKFDSSSSSSFNANEEERDAREEDHDNVFYSAYTAAAASTVPSRYGIQRLNSGDFTHNTSRSDHHQLSLLALLVALFRKSLIACKRRREISVEIGSPTDVRHVAHVTFDRFNGFLGLPEEMEPEVPSRAPSASANVFGVSAESMQLCYDPRGNSVPTILLMMQSTLYAKGGLQVEGIFRINAENTQEEYVRDQLNRGIVPENIDVHCLAGLIKAWFRELPDRVLDSLSSEQVMQCQSEEDCMDLFRLLPSTEAALLEWAVNLMADVVQKEQANKMNARNIAMVFAPNMTNMADPLTALMYAVQVMNFLKMMITKALKDREESMGDSSPCSIIEPSADNVDRSPANACLGDEEPVSESLQSEGTSIADCESHPLAFFCGRSLVLDEACTLAKETDAGETKGLESNGQENPVVNKGVVPLPKAMATA